MSVELHHVSLKAHSEENPSVSFDADWAELVSHVLKLPDSAYGNTGYLDSLLPEEMMASVMKGMDRYDRAFVAVRVRVRDHSGQVIREGVEVYFQRYSNGAGDIWVIGGALMISNMRQEDRKVLRELLANGKATIHHKDYLGKELPSLTVELF